MLADIPGLIEGAAEGVGLGHEFLAHVERCRVLVHLVAARRRRRSGEPTRSPRYETVRGELAAYGGGLDRLPEIVVLSKRDLRPRRGRRARGRRLARAARRSGARRARGLLGDRRRARRADAGRSSPAIPRRGAGGAAGVAGRARVRGRAHGLRAGRRRRLRGRARGRRPSASSGRGVEMLVARHDLSNLEALAYLEQRLREIGVIAALERAGLRARRRGPDRRGGVRAAPWLELAHRPGRAGYPGNPSEGIRGECWAGVRLRGAGRAGARRAPTVKAGAAVADASWHVGASAGSVRLRRDVRGRSRRTGPTTRPPTRSGARPPTGSSRGSRSGRSSSRGRRATASRSRRPTSTSPRTCSTAAPASCWRPRATAGSTPSTLTMTATHDHSSPMYSSTSWGVWAFQDVFDIRFYNYLVAADLRPRSRRPATSLVPVRVGAAVGQFDKTHRHSFGPAIADDGTPGGLPVLEHRPRPQRRPLRRRQRPGSTRSRSPTSSTSAATRSSSRATT